MCTAVKSVVTSLGPRPPPFPSGFPFNAPFDGEGEGPPGVDARVAAESDGLKMTEDAGAVVVLAPVARCRVLFIEENVPEFEADKRPVGEDGLVADLLPALDRVDELGCAVDPGALKVLFEPKEFDVL